MIRNILITGASGFLGTEICNNFKLKGYVILTLGRSIKNDIVCDLSKEVPLIPNIIFDIVLHCAGKAHTVPKNNQEANEFKKVNVKGTRNLLMGLDNLSKLPKSLVFISTVAVYGIVEGLLIKENNNSQATTTYGLSKKMAESYIFEWGKINNVKTCIIRAPLIVGKNSPGNLKFMLDSIKAGKYLNIGGGKAKRSMVLAEDLAGFIPVIAERGGVYNLTDGYHPSFFELSHLMAKHMGKIHIFNIPIITAKFLAIIGDLMEYLIKFHAPFNSYKLKKMTSSLTFDDSKARDLGWNPRSVLANPDVWLNGD